MNRRFDNLKLVGTLRLLHTVLAVLLQPLFQDRSNTLCRTSLGKYPGYALSSYTAVLYGSFAFYIAALLRSYAFRTA